jgi:hypothetical protein
LIYNHIIIANPGWMLQDHNSDPMINYIRRVDIRKQFHHLPKRLIEDSRHGEALRVIEDLKIMKTIKTNPVSKRPLAIANGEDSDDSMPDLPSVSNSSDDDDSDSSDEDWD